MEVFWTGVGSLIKGEYRLVSNTSLWMFFIYGSACFLGPIGALIASFPLVIRGLVYMLCIFAAEFAAGTIMKKADVCPWDYSGSRYSVKGVIRLDYAPVWFAVGLIFEYVGRFLF